MAARHSGAKRLTASVAERLAIRDAEENVNFVLLSGGCAWPFAQWTLILDARSRRTYSLGFSTLNCGDKWRQPLKIGGASEGNIARARFPASTIARAS